MRRDGGIRDGRDRKGGRRDGNADEGEGEALWETLVTARGRYSTSQRERRVAWRDMIQQIAEGIDALADVDITVMPRDPCTIVARSLPMSRNLRRDGGRRDADDNKAPRPTQSANESTH